jgi:mycofactocin system creatininase family protein
VKLSDATWTDVGDALVLVPVGSLEQHGPHLPLDTDTAIAQAVADGIAQAVANSGATAWVAPALTYTSSGEHQAFAGTSSIGNEALLHTVVELARSMTTWASRIVLVNAHGGNVPTLKAACAQLADEGRDVSWFACATENVDLHAGRTETSLMLHIRPQSVRLDRAEAGDTRALRDILPTLISGGVAAVSPNGVLGDPAGATAHEGRQVLEQMIADGVAAVGAHGGQA